MPQKLEASCRWGAGGYALPSRCDLEAGIWVVAATCATAQRLLRLDPSDAGSRATRRRREAGAFEPSAYAFSHVIVDEAGQASEPECLCSLSGALAPASAEGAAAAAGAGRIVLAGDPRQLGPVLQSKGAADAGLGLSFLERLMGTPGGPHAHRVPADELHPRGFHPAFVSQLTHNYRSHEALFAVSNALFYDGALLAKADRCECVWLERVSM